MEGIISAILAIAVGLAGLVWGADRFVTGSAGFARNIGVSPLVIGLTVVSIGTSAPEIIVAINASLRQAGDLAVGNAIGSNLANIGMVLGVTALVAPVPTQRHLLYQETPTLLAVTLLAGACLYNHFLGQGESLLLLALVPVLLWAAVYYKKGHPSPEEIEEGQSVPAIATIAAILWFLVGLGVMLLGSELLVWGAKTVALGLGVSELIIGLTIVAVGTSLPELAASVTSAIKGHHDIAIGNVFGSNLFNLLAVMPVAGAIAPLQLDPQVFYRDYLAMAALTLVLIVAIFLARRHKALGNHRLSRLTGAALLSLYLGYYLLLAVTG